MAFFSYLRVFFILLFYFVFLWYCLRFTSHNYINIQTNMNNEVYSPTQWGFQMPDNENLSSTINEINDFIKDKSLNKNLHIFDKNINYYTNPTILNKNWPFDKIYDAENYMIKQFYDFEPNKTFVDLTYRRKNFKTASKALANNIKIFYDILTTQNEIYKNNQNYNETIYNEFKANFEYIFAYNIYQMNYFYNSKCESLFYELLLPQIKIHECILNLNDDHFFCNVLGNIEQCCEALVIHKWDKQKNNQKLKKMLSKNKNLKSISQKIFEYKNKAKCYALYEKSRCDSQPTRCRKSNLPGSQWTKTCQN